VTADRRARLARLRTSLRAAERDLQGFAAFDAWPGQPWASHRDAAAGRCAAIKREIAALTVA
jgi:hypothetical protein